jgi:hypothetical protein
VAAARTWRTLPLDDRARQDHDAGAGAVEEHGLRIEVENRNRGWRGHVAEHRGAIYAGRGSSGGGWSGRLGFNGGKPLYLAVAGCIPNDLFREACVRYRVE